MIAVNWKFPTNLYTISIDNPQEIHQLTDSTMNEFGGGLDWTQDGKSLIYTKTEGNSSSNIWRLDLETLEQKQLTFEENSWNGVPDLSVNPKTNEIFFISNRTGTRHVWKMNIDGSNQEQYLNTSVGEASPEVSNDGKWLTYVTSGLKPNTLWKIHLDKKGEPHKIIDEGASGAHSISPDLKKVVAGFYDKNEKKTDPWKYIFVPFNKNSKNNFADYISAADSLEWSPDSQGVYLLNRKNANSNIFYYSLESHLLKQITNFNSQTFTRISVSPDGKTIAATRGRRNTNLISIKNY